MSETGTFLYIPEIDLPAIWKDMRLAPESLNCLRKDTLHAICSDMGGEPGKKPTKASLVAKLNSLLKP